MQFQDAFISYGRADSKAFAAKLHRQLIEQGLQVWFDFNDIPLGVDYQQEINDGIEKSHNFLFIISPHSVNSPYCKKEIELALRYNKRIIPLLHVEQIDQATWQQRHPQGTIADWETYQAKGLHSCYPNMDKAIAKINWVYCREGFEAFEQSLAGLLEIFERQKTYVHQHTLFLTKALDWQRQQKLSRYLLTGEERQQAEAWLKLRFQDGLPPCQPTDLHCEFITESIKNANNLMTQVFLAYAQEDWTVVQQVRRCLMREGFTVWTNKTDIQTGTVFETAIERGIEEADNIVYLVSPDSLRSPYCQQEINYALSLNKRIIPVLVKAIDPADIPPSWSRLQYIESIETLDSSSEADYALDEQQLLRALQQDAAYHEDHKILLTKALKWKRQNQNPTMLLTGYNLRYAEAWLKVAKTKPQYPPIALQEELIHESLRQPPGVALDVFISYSRADSGFARQINEALQIQGKRTWFDQESIASGSNFQQEIYRGIESADHFLFIISPSSVQSPYCADEVEYAANLNKRFVTVLHRSIDSSILHPELAKVQWIDFNRRNGDFSANFKELIRILDTDLDHLRSHTRLLIRAIEWDDKRRSDSLLLRGDDLEQAEEWLTQGKLKHPQPTELQQEYIQNSRSVEDANQRASQILQKAARQGKQRVLIGTVVMAIGLGVAAIAGVVATRRIQQVQQLAALERTTTSVLQQILVNGGDDVDLLVTALRSGRDLQSLTAEGRPLEEYPTVSPILALQQTADRLLAPDRFSGSNRLEGHQGSINSVVFSPDRQTVPSELREARIATASDDYSIRIWSTSGELLHELPGESWAYSVRFSPDGQIIASADEEGKVRLWNRSGQLLRTIAHQSSVYSVSFSADGETIAAALENGKVQLWDQSGQALGEFQASSTSVNSVSFNPDGLELSGVLIATASQDGIARLWSRSGQLLQELKGHSAPLTSIAFSPDGQTIATASQDRTLRLWTRSGELLRELKGHRGWVNSVTFSADGRTLLTTSEDGTARLWSLSGEVLQELKGHRGAVNSASFSSDGQTIATASRDQTVRLWQRSPEQLQAYRGHQGVVYSVEFSPDGQTIATASGDRTARLWNRLGTLQHTLEGHQKEINSIAFSPDGQTVATASYDQTARLWSQSGQLLHSLEGHQGAVLSVDFSPTGEEVATASDDGTARLWTRSAQLLHELKEHQGIVWSVNFSADGQELVTASDDGTIIRWSRSGERLEQIQVTSQRTNEVTPSPVNSAIYSPNRREIATASEDGIARLWSFSGELLQEFQGHQGAVLSVEFSPDGQLLATTSRDGMAKLWTRSGQLLGEFKGHEGVVWSVSFSPDAQWIVTGSDDTTARLWRVYNFHDLMQLGCQWLKNYFAYNPNVNRRDRQLCRDSL